MKQFGAFRVYTLDREDFADNDSDKCIGTMIADRFNTEDAAEALHDTLVKMPAKDPSITSWLQWGFSAPSFFEDLLALSFEGCVFFFAEKRERLLPGDVLKRAIAEEIATLQQKQEEPVNKKQIAEIKDVVVARLLPKSHVKSRVIPMMFTMIGDQVLLYVFTSSAKLAEDALGCLRGLNGTLPILPFGTEFLHPIDAFLTDLLRKPEDYRKFAPARNAVLFERELGVVAYKDADLDIELNDTLREQLDNNFTCRKLQAKFFTDGEAFITVTLDAKGSFSGMKFSNMLEDRVRERDESGEARIYFQSYGFILSRTLNDMVWTIRSAMAAGEKQARENSQITELGQTNVATDFPVIEQQDDADDDEDFEL